MRDRKTVLAGILLVLVVVIGVLLINKQSGVLGLFPSSSEQIAGKGEILMNKIDGRRINDPPCEGLFHAKFSVEPKKIEESILPDEETLRRFSISEGHLDPDLASDYKILTRKCGDECYKHLIWDIRKGEALGEEFESNFGLDSRVDSNLLVVNPERNLPEKEVRPIFTTFYVIDRKVEGEGPDRIVTEEKELLRLCQNVPDELTDLIKEKLALETSFDKDKILLAIFFAEDKYLRAATQDILPDGSRERPGRYVFAKKDDIGDWRIVLDSLRPYDCSFIKSEGFPEYMYQDCDYVEPERLRDEAQ